jgi:hypothetical protein
MKTSFRNVSEGGAGRTERTRQIVPLMMMVQKMEQEMDTLREENRQLLAATSIYREAVRRLLERTAMLTA